MSHAVRVLLRPRWLVGHAIVLVVAVVFVNLGLWQLRRLEERRDRNDEVRTRQVEVVTLPAEGWDRGADLDELAYHRVVLRGSYDVAHELLVRFRTSEGASGYDVVTPLRTAEGVVLVNRGWVPLDVGDRWPAAVAAAPSGEVEVPAVVSPADRGGLNAGRLRGRDVLVVSTVDVGALHDRLPYDRLYALPVLATEATGELPQPVALPDLSNGPHLSYAIQWFSFTAIVVIGWALLCRRVVRQEQAALSTPLGTSG